jgi:redox-sensitive bicupin YhaK (pirin superfamily)
LPQADAEVDAEFHHHDSAQLPRIRLPGVEAVLIAGNAYGERSPVKVYAPMFLLEVQLTEGAELALPAGHAEHGVYVVEGALRWGELDIAATQMAVQTESPPATLIAKADTRIMLFGGAPLDGERHLWWNFVASSRERIEQAKVEWAAQRDARVPGDEDEFIPLPATSVG